MDYTVTSKYVRVSPRKARLVADAVRTMSVPDALYHLKYMSKKSGLIIYKTMYSAAANADSLGTITKDQLAIKRIEVNEGPTFKRWRPGSRGMAHGYGKYTSHVTVVLTTKEGAKATAKKQVSAKQSKQALDKTDAVAAPLKKPETAASPKTEMKETRQSQTVRNVTTGPRTTHK